MPQIVKGKIPNPAGPDWFTRNIPHAFAAIGIVMVAGFLFPESAVVAAVGAASKALGGVAGAVDLAHVIGSTPGSTVVRGYEVEARRRSYRQSV